MKFRLETRQLLNILGYDAHSYRGVGDFNAVATASHLYRIVSRLNTNNRSLNETKAFVHGAYFLQTSPNGSRAATYQPIVFIAEAEDGTTAQEALHRNLWLLGSAPFIIVILPSQIRIYTGFDYDKKREERGLIESVELEANLFGELPAIALRALADYSASAIEDGTIWNKLRRSKNVDYENRVDKRLLRNLKELEAELLGRLQPSFAERERALEFVHALIGKYVYLRYLSDRKIVTPEWAKSQGVDLEKVIGRNATLTELLKLDSAIEERFGGNVFPFPAGARKILTSSIISYVAQVFRGDEALGQQSFFDIYDFSYIPVETLSYIYEQFLRAQQKEKKDGAVYTPESLADYLLAEVNSIRPLSRGCRVLDPCCGSGIFLVLTYRHLIEKEMTQQRVKKLSPNVLKSIMEESIHGVERNLEACYVTEFSLILTLLNYLEPPDLDHRNNRRFDFPDLHNKNIFQGDFFEKRRQFYPLTMTFDFIVGNPPWIEPKTGDQEEELVLSWMDTNRSSRPALGNRVAEAFCWRAAEFLSKNGCVGFVIQGKSLFNHESKQFRRAFFSKNEIRRITNFSNFHYVLFPTVDVSAVTIVYQLPRPGKEKRPIHHYGPLLANQEVSNLNERKRTRPPWTITVNSSEIKMISPSDAEEGESTLWKMAMWGSYADERAVDKLNATFRARLSELARLRGWEVHKGLELRDRGEDSEPIEPLDGWIFDVYGDNLQVLHPAELTNSGARFHIPSSALKDLPTERRFVRKGRKIGYSVIPAPHCVVNTQYAIYSDTDFIVESQVAISAPRHDADYLRAISVYLSSTVCRYLMFFSNPAWGTDRSMLQKVDVLEARVPTFTADQIKVLAKLQRSLATREGDGNDLQLAINRDDLQRELDSITERTLQIPESLSILIRDFFTVKFSLNKGKTISSTRRVEALRRTELSDLRKYALRLRDELDSFAGDGATRHIVSILRSPSLVVCKVSPVRSREVQPVNAEEASDSVRDELNGVRNVLHQRFSHWLYIQKEVRYFNVGSKEVRICKSPRVIDWTQSQAIEDANDIISDVLSQTTVSGS